MKIKQAIVFSLLTIISLVTLPNIHPVSAATITELTGADLARQVDSLGRELAFLKSQLAARLAEEARLGDGLLTTTSTQCLNLTRNLLPGARDQAGNNDVTMLQSFLRDTGHFPFSSGMTGYFGDDTKRAVQSFQRNEGIISVGLPETSGYGAVGPATRARIQAISCGGSDSAFVNSPSDATITIISPLTGATWQSNAANTIAWTTNIDPTKYINQTSIVYIQLYKSDGTPIKTYYTGSTLADKYGGSYTIPANNLSAGSYYFGITIGGANLNVRSNFFTVVAPGTTVVSLPLANPTITINSPTAGAQWANNQGHTVTWSTFGVGLGTNIKMELLTPTNGTVPGFNSFTTANDGSESMSLASIAPGWYYFRLSATVNNQTIRGSSGAFQITGAGTTQPPTAPTLLISNPTGGSYQAGASLPVAWLPSNIPSGTNVNIRVINSGGIVTGASSLLTSAAARSATLTLNGNATAGQYRVWITATVNGQTVQAWSSWFNVTTTPIAPTITVTSPTAGATWQANVPNDVTWTSGLATSISSSIQIYRADGSFYRNYTGFTNSGSYKIPAYNFTAGSYYLNINVGTVTKRSDTFTVTTAPTNYTISGSLGTTGATVSITGGGSCAVSTSNYTCSGIPRGANVVITPSKSGGTFNPTSRTHSNVTTTASGQNFTFTANAAPTTYTLNITSAGLGSGTISKKVNGVLNSGPYAYGTMVTLTASPSANSSFVNWKKDPFTIISSSNSTTVTMNSNMDITAYFAPILNPTTYSVSGSLGTTGTGVSFTLQGSPGGSCVTSASNYTCSGIPSGANVVITPSKSGGTFSPTRWPHNNVTANATGNFTFTADSTTYTLTTQIAGTGSGTISRSPNQASYAPGTFVTITATPAAGSTFTGWSGSYGGTVNPKLISINSNVTAIANFTANAAPTTYQLSITKLGTGSGTVTGTGINCGVDCSESYTSGTLVTLTRAASSGSSFAGWAGGGCSGTATTCTVTLNIAKSVTATFDTVVGTTYSITTWTASGLGTISRNSPGPNYPSGTVVTLTATPAAGYAFSTWGSDCAGTGATCTLTMNANKGAAANFTANTAPTTYTISGSSNITDANVSINGGGSCSSVSTNVNTSNYTCSGIPRGANVVITPSKSGGTFSPASRTHSNVMANVTGQNFTFTANTAAQADLIISAPATLTASPTSVVAGGTVTLSGFTLKNQGNAASGGARVGLYLSSDSIITAGDIYLGNKGVYTLAAGATYNLGSTILTVPAGTAAGTYYLGTLFDDQNAVTESNESNNYKRVVLTVTR